MSAIVDYDHIFVDFDETLFNHYQFLNWLDDQLYKWGYLKADKGSFKSAIDDFHDMQQGNHLLRLYRHRDHVHDKTNQSWQQLSKLVTETLNLQQLDFCYPDAHTLLKKLVSSGSEVQILTFGDDEYQRFKINTCQFMQSHHIPIQVVNETKADYLAQHYNHAKGTLIDDKHPLNLPNNWHHIWINRKVKLAEPKRLTAREIQISSLDQTIPAITMP